MHSAKWNEYGPVANHDYPTIRNELGTLEILSCLNGCNCIGIRRNACSRDGLAFDTLPIHVYSKHHGAPVKWNMVNSFSEYSKYNMLEQRM